MAPRHAVIVPRAIGIIVLASALALGQRARTDPPTAGAPQTRAILPDLGEYDWTRWLVGEWEGWFEDPAGNRVRQWQSFEFAADRRYILVRFWQERGESKYHGIGIFHYDPGTGDAWARWFGIIGDWNYGLARRDGESTTWDIHRLGQARVQRVRERISENEFEVTSRSTDAQGRERLTREYMRRVGTPSGS